jgi:hypothetical protein
MELSDAICIALKPQSIKERLPWRKGWTAKDIFFRLPPEAQQHAAGKAMPDVADDIVALRRGIDKVQRTLILLKQAGKVHQKPASAWVMLKSKGERSVIVDLWFLK